MATWGLVLTDLNHRPVGEIVNAKERSFSRPLRGLGSGSFQVRLDHPLASQISSCAGFVKVFRNGSIFMHGPIVSAEENADSTTGSISVTMSDAGWFLSKRYGGKSANGTSYPQSYRRIQVAHLEIDAANTESETFVTRDFMSYGSGINSFSSFYVVGPYQTVLTTIQQMASGDSGFDWYIQPLDNYVSGAVVDRKLGKFKQASAVTRPEAIFEFGTGRLNVATYKRLTARDMQANKVYHSASAGPDAPGYPTVNASDPTSIATWGEIEDVAQADLDDPTLRQQLVNRHVSMRKNPRQILTFTPVSSLGSRVPDFGTDFNLGDWIRARIAYAGVTRLDALLRVYGVSFTIDDLGVEKLDLTLVDPGDSG